MRAPPCSSDPAELLKAEVIDDPYPFLARLREQHPVSRVGDTGVHVVATWDGVLEALGREDDFSANLTGMLVRDENGQPTPFDLPPLEGAQVIATADEPHHGVHRRLVTPRLTAERVAALEPRIREWACTSLEAWIRTGGGEFIPIAERIPARVVGALLGLPDGDAERHRAWAMMGGEMLAGDVAVQDMIGLADEAQRMGRYLARHLEDASEDPPEPDQVSLLHLLAAGIAREEITLAAATGIASVMFGAGGESTAALIGSAVRWLAQDPAVADELRRAPERISRFVEEIVRLEPPFKFHYRAVRRECEFRGFSLVPGDRLMLMWAAANRDPAIFEDPDAMRLDRKHPKLHMGFGRGLHFCVGAPLARLEARVVVEELLSATKHFEIDPESPPAHARSIFTRRLESLVVAVHPMA